MPRWARIVVWAVVFAVSAGAGAYVAAHTNPFPPGVEDPGARPPATSSSTPPPTTSVAHGTLTARTTHRLHYGGSCTSDWKGTWRAVLTPEGRIASGSGVARLVPGSAGCDFAQAQVQAKAVRFSVSGTWTLDASGRVVVHPRFADPTADPLGSQDLGALVATLPQVRPSPAAQEASRLDVSRPDGDEGTYVGDYTVGLTP